MHVFSSEVVYSTSSDVLKYVIAAHVHTGLVTHVASQSIELFQYRVVDS